MANTPVKIVQLRIMLNTNNGKQVELKPEMFENVSGKGGPYLCTNVDYSKSTLMLLPHNERVNTFMDKEKFTQYCLTSRSKKTMNNAELKDANEKVNRAKIANKNAVDANKQSPNIAHARAIDATRKVLEQANSELNKLVKSKNNDLINKNIYIMLNAMFPVSFPVDSQVESLCPELSNLPSESLYIKLTKPYQNTHLTIDSKPTTVTRVVWLNVMYHNPVYKQLYTKVKTYYEKMFAYCIKYFVDVYKNTPDEIYHDAFATETDIGNWKTSDETLIDDVDGVNAFVKQLHLNDDKSIYSIYRFGDSIKTWSTVWKLYYMFKGLKPKTREYNEFMEKYVELFINVKSTELIKLEKSLETKQNELKKATTNANIIKIKDEIDKIESDIRYQKRISNRSFGSEEQRQESNEKRFKESVQNELVFHFDYMKEVAEFTPLKRQSLNDSTSGLFKDNMLDAQRYTEAFTEEEYCTAVDKIDDGKLYEIQLGVSIVGGKITESSTKLSCKFSSNKLTKYIKDYTNGITDRQAYPAYPYLDLEEDIKRIEQTVVKPGQGQGQAVKTGGRKLSRKNKKNTRRITKKI